MRLVGGRTVVSACTPVNRRTFTVGINPSLNLFYWLGFCSQPERWVKSRQSVYKSSRSPRARGASRARTPAGLRRWSIGEAAVLRTLSIFGCNYVY